MPHEYEMTLSVSTIHEMVVCHGLHNHSEAIEGKLALVSFDWNVERDGTIMILRDHMVGVIQHQC